MEDDNIDYDEYNQEEDYNEYNEDDIEDNLKTEEKKEKLINEQSLKEYEIIKNSEIIKKRDVIISKFIEFSNLVYDEAELVLIYYDWNYDKLLEDWFDNIDKISIESHISQSKESEEKIKNFIEHNNISENICPICFIELEKEEVICLKCNHKICKDCYVEYITNKLLTEPNMILMTPCPLKGCNLNLTRTIFKKCITEKKYQLIFAKSLVRNFIARSNNIKSCPNPKCNLSVRVPVSLSKEIKCDCGSIFCFQCLEESHIPCDCEMAKLWKESTKEKGSGEDFVWMKENTKNCPKCGINIEKNQGCNHMCCQKKAGGCGFEFCWVCLGPWNSHEIVNLDSFYKCYKTPEEKKEKEKNKGYNIPKKFEEKFLGKKKDLLDRYISYYKEWDNHRKNLEYAEKLKDKVKKYKKDLIEVKLMFENDVNFLDESLDMIIECNRLLKNTFVFEYFLADDKYAALFEHNLEILQAQTDSLLELIELEQLPNIMRITNKEEFQKAFLKYKDHALGLIKSTKSFKKNLIEEIENNLNLKFNYDIIKDLDKTLKVNTRSKKK